MMQKNKSFQNLWQQHQNKSAKSQNHPQNVFSLPLKEHSKLSIYQNLHSHFAFFLTFLFEHLGLCTPRKLTVGKLVLLVLSPVFLFNLPRLPLTPTNIHFLSSFPFSLSNQLFPSELRGSIIPICSAFSHCERHHRSSPTQPQSTISSSAHTRSHTTVIH